MGEMLVAAGVGVFLALAFMALLLTVVELLGLGRMLWIGRKWDGEVVEDDESFM